MPHLTSTYTDLFWAMELLLEYVNIIENGLFSWSIYEVNFTPVKIIHFKFTDWWGLVNEKSIKS